MVTKDDINDLNRTSSYWNLKVSLNLLEMLVRIIIFKKVRGSKYLGMPLQPIRSNKVKLIIVGASMFFCACNPKPKSQNNEDHSEKNLCKLELVSEKEYKQNDDPCIEKLMDYHPLWICDSLAMHGFRLLLANEFLSKCNLEGKKWSQVEKYFGRPNYLIDDEGGTTTYRYRASYFREGHENGPGNLFVDFRIKNGVIIKFNVYEIDG